MGFFPLAFICKSESRDHCVTNGAENLTSYVSKAKSSDSIDFKTFC